MKTNKKKLSPNIIPSSLFDFTENRIVRDEAIQTAIDGAENVVPNWSARCYQELIKFVDAVGEFQTEDFISYLLETNFPVPNERRAFGGVIQAAVRRELIIHTGEYREKKSIQSHMNPTKVWIKKK